MRHGRPWWDVHRHRIAPEVAGTVARMVAEGRLEIVAGGGAPRRAVEDALEVEYRKRRSSSLKAERFAYAFNCTGPLHSMARTRDPLLRSLPDAGQARAVYLCTGHH